jgi:2-methylcitrate dehydratase PrpD
MTAEQALTDWVHDTCFADLSAPTVELTKKSMLTILGTTIVGSGAEGCQAVVEMVRTWAGRPEATIHVHGGRVPAPNAVLVNSMMARANDLCDAMDPGLHNGSTVIPAALAAAELVGGCTGQDFITAVVTGTELSARLAVLGSEDAATAPGMDGFDPTGITSVIGAAAATGRILGLDRRQMLNALALAFNRSGGSFQANLDGSLAVRMIQAFAAQNGLVCALLAQRGITGPRNFIDGDYGFFHLYTKGRRDREALTGELGIRWQMYRTGYKHYPSCGTSIASTDAILRLAREHDLAAEDVDEIGVRVTPAIYGLVGHGFTVGDNPTVNAQFSIEYCVANALMRKRPELRHFDADYVTDPQILELVQRVHVRPDPSVNHDERRFRGRSIVRVTKRDGHVLEAIVDGPSGFPTNPMTEEQHAERFWDSVNYADAIAKDDAERIVEFAAMLDTLEDVRSVIAMLARPAH